MPYSPGGIYTLPAIYLAVPGTTIIAQQHNDPLVDLQTAQNYARPIIAGGSGAITAVAGHDAFMTLGNNIASSATVNLDVASGAFIAITGTTAVSAVTLTEGRQRIARTTSALQFTAGASLIVNGTSAVNYTTAAGELLLIEGYAGGVVRVWSIGKASYNVSPPVNDGGSLGSGTLGWSGLNLASGALINWGNGDVVLSHTAGTLTFNGATSGYVFDDAVLGAGLVSAGTQFSVGTFGVASNGKVMDAIALSSSVAGGGATVHIAFWNNQASAVGSISTSGTTTSFNTTSDERLKTNFRELKGGGILDALEVYEFEWKSDGTTSQGLKAQEAHKVLPSAVTPGTDDKQPGDPGYEPWMIDYSKFVPALLAELKFLQARVAALEGA